VITMMGTAVSLGPSWTAVSLGPSWTVKSSSLV